MGKLRETKVTPQPWKLECEKYLDLEEEYNPPDTPTGQYYVGVKAELIESSVTEPIPLVPTHPIPLTRCLMPLCPVTMEPCICDGGPCFQEIRDDEPTIRRKK